MNNGNSRGVAIIGGGNMGEAFAAGFIENDAVAPEDLSIVERSASRRAELASSMSGVALSPSVDERTAAASLVLLAVKPQEAKEACAELAKVLRPEQLVLSIMAGVTLRTLSTLLGGHGRIARAMPNLPATVGAGMTVYFVPPERADADAGIIDEICSACGAALPAAREELIDAATALSGTGPAYCFYFLEQLVEAGKSLGFDESDARQLAGMTLHGAVELWHDDDLSLTELRARVTSKGGTTAAAFELLESRKWGEILRAAVQKAAERAKELGRELEAKLGGAR